MPKNSVIQMENAILAAAEVLSGRGGEFATDQVQDNVEKEMHVRPGDDFTTEVLMRRYASITTEFGPRWVPYFSKNP